MDTLKLKRLGYGKLVFLSVLISALRFFDRAPRRVLKHP